MGIERIDAALSIFWVVVMLVICQSISHCYGSLGSWKKRLTGIHFLVLPYCWPEFFLDITDTGH